MDGRGRCLTFRCGVPTDTYCPLAVQALPSFRQRLASQPDVVDTRLSVRVLRSVPGIHLLNDPGLLSIGLAVKLQLLVIDVSGRNITNVHVSVVARRMRLDVGGSLLDLGCHLFGPGLCPHATPGFGALLLEGIDRCRSPGLRLAASLRLGHRGLEPLLHLQSLPLEAVFLSKRLQRTSVHRLHAASAGARAPGPRA